MVFMEGQIVDVVLFVSSSSMASKQCIQLFSKKQIPARIVRLDTPSIRKIVQNSKFRIGTVPTLIILMRDGGVHKRVGIHEIGDWVEEITKIMSPPPIEDEYAPVSNSVGETPPPVKEVDSYDDQYSSSRNDSGLTFVSVNDDGGSHSNPRPRIHKPELSAPSTQRNPINAGMSDVKSLAKMMEQQRSQTLGIPDT